MWQSQGDLPLARLCSNLTQLYSVPQMRVVKFKNRTSAKSAAEAWTNGLDMDGERLGVCWGQLHSCSVRHCMCHCVAHRRRQIPQEHQPGRAVRR
jgi:hypothetical protein